MPKINLGDSYWKLDIPKLERQYGATYVGEFPIVVNDIPIGYPASVFWRPEHLRTSQLKEYIGLFKPQSNGSITCMDAGYITEYIFNGLQLGDEVIYSRWGHDYRGFDSLIVPGEDYKGPAIDGGWDYCKTNNIGDAKLVRLQVVEGIITILEDN